MIRVSFLNLVMSYIIIKSLCIEKIEKCKLSQGYYIYILKNISGQDSHSSAERWMCFISHSIEKRAACHPRENRAACSLQREQRLMITLDRTQKNAHPRKNRAKCSLQREQGCLLSIERTELHAHSRKNRAECLLQREQSCILQREQGSLLSLEKTDSHAHPRENRA